MDIDRNNISFYVGYLDIIESILKNNFNKDDYVIDPISNILTYKNEQGIIKYINMR